MKSVRPLPTATPAGVPPRETGVVKLLPLLPEAEARPQRQLRVSGQNAPTKPTGFRKPDDPFQLADFAAARANLDQGEFGGYLPRLVPREPRRLRTVRNPWAVNSVADLFRVYLPELSISFGMVVVCGSLAGQIIHRFLHSISVGAVIVAYVFLFLIYNSSIYLGDKAKHKGEFRSMLLTCLVMTIPHAAASALVKAAG
jgi:hypothetical protein